jgi:hypothetical protein
LQAEFRTKFNLWVFLILGFMILQTIGTLILDTECPFYNYKYQSSGARAKSWLAFLFIPLSQAMIDYGLMFISGQALKSLLPGDQNDFLAPLAALLSFVSTMLMLVFKVAGPEYDQLIALVFPIIKLLPLWICLRDSLETARQFRGHLVTERADQTNQGKLITLYRLHATFM